MTWDELTDIEKKLVLGAEQGTIVEVSADGAAEGASWGEERTICAELIVNLCTREEWPVAPPGVRLRGARISGSLNFEAATLRCPLQLINCWIEKEVYLSDAETRAIRFSGSHLHGIRGHRARIKGALFLDGEFANTGSIGLVDARIEGSLVAQGASFNGLSSGSALEASRISVLGSVLFKKKFTSMGVINLVDAKIGGSFICEDSSLSHPQGSALVADRLRAGCVILRDCQVKGAIQIIEAQIEGSIDLRGTSLEYAAGDALIGDGLSTKGAVLMDQGFKARGRVRLGFAKIGATLHCDGAKLSNPGKLAFCAPELSTGSSLTFKDGFSAHGGIALQGATIGGSLIFQGARVRNRGERAINLSSASVKREVQFLDTRTLGEINLFGVNAGGNVEFLRSMLFGRTKAALRLDRSSLAGGVHLSNGFRAKGEVRMAGARIGTMIEMRDACIRNLGKPALYIPGINVLGNMNLQGAKFRGALIFHGAQLGATLDLDNATINAADCEFAMFANNFSTKGSILGRGAVFEGGINLLHACIGGEIDLGRALVTQGVGKHALYAGDMKVGGGLFWRKFQRPATGTIDLRDAKVGQLYDDSSSWPATSNVLLEGFEYQAFGLPMIDIRSRIQWLEKQDGFSPGPYEQVIRVLRRSGHEGDARLVAFTKQEARRTSGSLSRPAWAWSLFLRWTIGHGYYIHRAVVISLVVIALGAGIFNCAFDKGAMAPIKDRPPHFVAGQEVLYVPPFNPSLYSADVFFPIINFHQEEYWLPVGKDSQFFRTYLWIHILLGWILTTLIVSSLSGLVKKD